MSDHTRSRWGRRKPYLFVSAPVLCVTFVLIWAPPVPRASPIVRKTGWAGCSLIMVGVLGRFGCSAANPQGVRLIWPICAGACLAGLVAFIPYRLGDSKAETGRRMNLEPPKERRS